MSDTDSTGTAIPSLPFSSPPPTGVAVHELTISNILIAHRDDGKIVLQIVDGAGGTVITPDGSTLIVGETAAARYTAFTIADDGSLTDQRVWAQVEPAPEISSLEATLAALRFGPDGCTLDAEGMIWAADEVNGRLARVAEGGEVVDEIPSPEGLNFFACALGGEDGKTMLICAAPDFLEANRVNARDAVLLTTRVDVPHAGLP